MEFPSILKETSNGYARIPIADKMLEDRQVLCIGEINAQHVNELILQLLYLESEEPTKPITLYINSPGGEISSGLALYDTMQAISCPIRTVCMGMAASMGALLFAAGDHRYILPHGKVMIHDPRTFNVGGAALTLQQISDNLMNTRKICAEILAKHTKHTIEEIYEKTVSDTFFNANEAIAFGLCDTLLQKMNEL